MTTPAGEPPAVVAAPPGPGDGPQYFSHQQILVILFGVMAGMLLAALDQSIVGTALPRIVSELGGLDQLSWVVTAYLLTSTATTPLWGKISDLYGRRPIFQVAIVIFLLGSVLCGLSQNMPQLIAFRAIQGVGGGGLIAIAFSIIGDVIPPRERGRYQGYFGAVFGVSSVAGPLLGGWFTDGPGWRWIFYINLPVGLAALVVTSMALKMPVVRREHKIDYLGAAMIVAAVSSLLLYLDWGGKEYGWTAPGALALLAGSWCCRSRSSWSSGAPPSRSSRCGCSATRCSRRQRLRLSGRHRDVRRDHLPAVLPAGGDGDVADPVRPGHAAGGHRHLLHLDHLRPADQPHRPLQDLPDHRRRRAGRRAAAALSLAVDTPYWQVAIYEFVFGAGLGLTMQTIVTAVQNAVEFRDLGAATSSTTFFRQMGGTIGAAVFGAVLSSRLAHYLTEAFAQAGIRPGAGGVNVNANNVQAIQQLAEPVKSLVLGAFAHALDDVFLIGVPFIVVALVVALFLREVPLRTGPGAPGAPGVGGS